MRPHQVGPLADTTTSIQTATTVPTVAITVLILVLILIRRARGSELRPAKLILLPILPMVLGVGAVLPEPLSTGLPRLHGIDYLVLGADLVFSVVFGWIRGSTVLIYPRDGATWYRYGPATILLWVLVLVLRVAIGVYGAHHGATPLVSGNIVLLMFGLTVLIQNLVVLGRSRTGRTGRAGLSGPRATADPNLRSGQSP